MNQSPLLNIQNLVVSSGEATILKGLNLSINPGEVHVIMGPNGSGKSTLSSVIARHPDYTIESGQIQFLGEDISELNPEEMAWKGLFLGFQYPVAIPGISNIQFLKSAYNAVMAKQDKKPLDAVDFLKLVKQKMAELSMPESLLYRPINDGFSGGEKKRNEILQLALLEPKLAILDEIDSGLDIDALKFVAEGINRSRHPDRSILLITHYQRLLDYVEPDFVHVVSQGQCVKSGDKSLAKTLESEGYAWASASQEQA